MLDTLKQRLLTVVPQPAIFRGKTTAQRAVLRRHRVAASLEAAEAAPHRLDMATLELLDREFPARSHEFVDAQWTEDAIAERAGHRIDRMAALLGSRWDQVDTVLETGVGDGVQSRLMATRHGKTVTANDHQSDELRDDVVAAGIEFVKASASDLPLDDDRFDLVVSHDAFEHFDDPEGALDESIRVTKPGGLMYLRFGPLYRSSDGLHAGARLGVPFAPVLFDRATLDDFVEQHHREPIYHHYCNEWTLAQFRGLFASRAEQVETVHSFEHLELAGVELITRYPDIFRATSDDLDEFVVAYLELVLRKR